MNRIVDHIRRAGLGMAALAGLSAVAAAPATADMAQNWQLGYIEAASPVMEDIEAFNNGLLIVITLITLFVTVLLIIVMVRFNAKRNPVPSRTTHNTLIEVLWTALPAVILIAIAIPSFSLLFSQYDPGRVIEDYNPDDAITVKATGFQWFWSYGYPDNGGFEVFSNPIRDENGEPGGNPRLLETDNPMVVPVDTVIRMQITSDPTGVIHAFAMPAMGVKADAVPGRITEQWFLANREGIFYGQCSELCGLNHFFMPIELRVVSQEVFDQWVTLAPTNPTGANELLDTWEAGLSQQVAAR